MIPAMKAYLDLLEHILVHGKPREDRTALEGYDPLPAIRAEVAV